MAIFSLLFLFLLASASWGQVEKCAPEIPNNGHFDFAKVIFRMKLPGSEKTRMLARACEQFSLDEKDLLTAGLRKLRKSGGATAWAQKTLVPTLNQINTVWSSLGDSPVEKAYRTKLAEIAKIPDPDERIRHVYLLARKSQGLWRDDEKPGTGILGIKTPGDVLKDAEETGSGGVCKDFSTLLIWSLNQVSKSPVGIPRDQFQAEYTSYPGHAIVTVKTFDNPNSRLAKAYSLDPTNYQDFTPIPVPDLNGSDADYEQRYEACLSIRQCVENKPRGSSEAPGGSSGPAGLR